MLRTTLLLCMLLLIGCDFSPGKVLDATLGRSSHQVVFAAKPIQLSEQVVAFTPSEPMKVLGEWSSVCLVLRDQLPLQDAKVMDAAFSAALRSARVQVDIVLSSGDRLALRRPFAGLAEVRRGTATRRAICLC